MLKPHKSKAECLVKPLLCSLTEYLALIFGVNNLNYNIIGNLFAFRFFIRHNLKNEDALVLLQDGTVHDPMEGQCFQRMCLPCARSVLMEACRRIAKVFEDVK